jgi:hypothetical protein
MLTPTSKSRDGFVEIKHSPNGYSLSDIRLDIPDPSTAVFKATLNGPAGSPVWARAWLSTEKETVAESASPKLKAGDEVTLPVKLRTGHSPEYAYMRIESTPLHTEQVVMLKLTVA